MKYECLVDELSDDVVYCRLKENQLSEEILCEFPKTFFCQTDYQKLRPGVMFSLHISDNGLHYSFGNGSDMKKSCFEKVAKLLQQLRKERNPK